MGYQNSQELSIDFAVDQAHNQALTNILNLVSLKKSSKTSIKKILNSNCSLCLELIKLINTKILRGNREKFKLEDSLNLLGLYGFRDLVLLAIVKSHCQDLETWRKSLFNAFLAKNIAKAMKLSNRDTSYVFSCGLIYNLVEKKLISLDKVPENIRETIENIIENNKNSVFEAILISTKKFSELEILNEKNINQLIRDPRLGHIKYFKIEINLEFIQRIDREIYKLL